MPPLCPDVVIFDRFIRPRLYELRMERTDNGEDRGRHRRERKRHRRPVSRATSNIPTGFGRIRQRHDIWRHGKERHDIAIRHGTAYPGHDIAIRHGTAYPGTTVRGTARHIPAPWCAASLFTAWHAARRCATIRHGMTRGTMARDSTRYGTIRHAARWCATIRMNTERNTARYDTRHDGARQYERIRHEIWHEIRYAARRCATIRTNEYGMKYGIRREILYAAQWCASELMARADSPEIKI